MAQPAPDAGARERRRYRRTATRLPALVRFSEGNAIRCEIRGYCPTGLLVAFLEEKPPRAIVAALVGQSIQVELDVGSGPEATSVTLTGRVAHASPAGVGAHMARMPEAALEAMGSAGGLFRESEESAEEPPEQVLALHRECAGALDPFLDAVIKDFFRDAEKRLGAAIDAGRSLAERSVYLGAACELAQHRRVVEDRFHGAVRDRLGALTASKRATEATPPTDDFLLVQDSELLALVEDSELEDSLSLSAVTGRIEAEIASELAEFERRYSHLVALPIDRKDNPFGPDAIGHAFRDAIDYLDLERSARGVLYDALGQALRNHSRALFRELNGRLARLASENASPLDHPSSPESSRKRHARVTSLGDRNASVEGHGAADSEHQWPPPRATGAYPPGGRAEWGPNAVANAAGLERSRTSAAADGSAALAAPFRGRSSEGASGTGSGRGQDLLQLVGNLQDTVRQLQGPIGAPGHAPAGAAHGESLPALPQADLRDLLVALDKLPQVPHVAGGGEPAPALAERVAAQIAVDTGGSKGVALAARQVLDSVSGLLGHAKTDYVAASDLGSLVERLERPLLKLALKDDRFAGSPDHPARQMLNLIDQYAAAADDRGRFFDANLQGYLSQLVDLVSRRADDDPAIFETARDKLRKMLQPILRFRRTRVMRIQQACEGRQNVRTSRSRVRLALEQRLGGRDVPAAVLRLLDAGWRQYLVFIAIRQGGAKGEEWDAALAVLDELCARLAGPADSAAVSEDSRDHGALLDEIRRGLATVSVDGQLLASFLDELADALSSNEPNDAETRVLVPVSPGALALATEGPDEPLPVGSALARRLLLGDWWHFDLDGVSVPMQLVWLSRPPSSCAFANRSATNKMDLTLAQLSERIGSGEVKPGRDLDLPLLERSEVSLFDETYSQLMHQAMHDRITDLPNRKGFMQRLAQLAAAAGSNDVHSVCIIEFDHFRTIYDTCGIEAAEGLARTLAGEVRDKVGADAFLASFRDDTLALLLFGCRSGGCDIPANLLSQLKGYRFQHQQHSYSIGLNIGIAEHAPLLSTAEETVRRADSACIAAKTLGRNRLQTYEEASPELKTQESLMEWAGRIDSFLSGNGLYLRCQRVTPIRSGSALLPYYELLLGIRTPSGTEVPPLHFIPAVTRLNRSHELDMWVIRRAFDWILANPSIFASIGGFAINLTATSLGHPEVTDCILGLLDRLGDIPAEKIAFEITETAAIESYAAAQEFMRIIRRHGCKFSLDDFGTGFTSFAHLKNLRTDTLKIDGSFVKDMLRSPEDSAMVRSMNDIAHSLGLRTVAEYVETDAILEKLGEIGVDYAQGYVIHKPCPLDELLQTASADAVAPTAAPLQNP